VAIYTGDSSTTGASVDQLNIHTLSTSNVGDSGGAMSYSNGQSNVFVDLSKGGTAAGLGDAFTNATTTMNVNYMATGVGGSVTQQTATISVGGATGYADTVQGMISAINNASLGLTASFGTASQAGKQAVTAGTASDTGILISGTGSGVGNGTTPGAVGTLLSTGAATDGLTGTLTVKDASGVAHTITLGAVGTTDNLLDLANTVNAAGYGITIAYSAGSKSDVFTSASSTASITATSLADSTTPAAVPTYTAAAAYYSVGVTNSGSGTASPDLADAATGQTAAAGSTFTADPNGQGGVATISYSDGAGEDLSGTNLTTQTNAQAALNDLNVAISDVAAQDGYIGAQINTLNSISQVMSTQQENVVSAQNAIQATDYASATSNMSKYEILSQTGIAALAQANSVQQEVTKLLQ
jgi:flagellin